MASVKLKCVSGVELVGLVCNEILAPLDEQAQRLPPQSIVGGRFVEKHASQSQ